MISQLSLDVLIALALGAAVVILLAGTRMTGLADRIADRTGFGEALTGGVLLGASTSFSGAIVSVTAALDGQASLAFSNGVGGIAAQTAFLAMADVLFRRANLEHASADLANIFQCAVLILLLTIPFVAYVAPSFTVFAVHPASIVLFAVYIGGVIATARLSKNPMWTPVRTGDTHCDTPGEDDAGGRALFGLLITFAILVAVLGLSGWLVAKVGAELTTRLNLSASFVGAAMTAVVTSLPELVTTLAAVRRGALQLAIGGIIGGNTFDTLFLTMSDIAYREGSIYHAIQVSDLFWLAINLTMSTVLLLGLLFRERHGPAGIGAESVALFAIYFLALVLQFLTG